ncbi:hypothetical protein Peur_065593 [Populus x canadensis]
MRTFHMQTMSHSCGDQKETATNAWLLLFPSPDLRLCDHPSASRVLQEYIYLTMSLLREESESHQIIITTIFNFSFFINKSFHMITF